MSDYGLTLGAPHTPSSSGHPADAPLNQQIIEGGRQIGALEHKISPQGDYLGTSVTNRKGWETNL